MKSFKKIDDEYIGSPHIAPRMYASSFDEFHDLSKAVSSINLDEGYNLLLSHTYDIIDSISPYMNIDLILAGDTHGGQINIPVIGKKLLSLKYKFGYKIFKR